MSAFQHILIFFAFILGVSRHDGPMLVSAQFEFGAAFETSDASSSLSSVVAPDNTGTFVLGGATSTEGDGDPTPNQIIKAFLDDFDHRADGEFPGLMEKKWTYYTNLTEENRQIKVEAQIRITRFDSEARQTAQTYYHTYPSHQISYDIRRELEAVASTSGSPKYVNEVTQELEDVKSRMEQRYHTAQVCRKKRGRRARQECLPLDPVQSQHAQCKSGAEESDSEPTNGVVGLESAKPA
ncbi:angiotensin-converting enzyme 2-like [Lytechinus variegatus]|uniref:angiotensin-converting enzyme 2-like n=1 Tax=Lytechinus variegatus TaxID=7654 RepID=UPI001BB2B7A4|nr:angiotensin-converting enzyme 2-like [Lytechinus variegatus]